MDQKPQQTPRLNVSGKAERRKRLSQACEKDGPGRPRDAPGDTGGEQKSLREILS